MTNIPLGKTVITPKAQATVSHDEALMALARHASGDWGKVDAEDKQRNDQALNNGDRLVSAYTTLEGTRFLIITEWDRSVTTILLPSEY